ncbi:MAG: DNA starvation/stationary phase protection protein [Verrucomicrobiota bacterium]
MDKKLSKCLHQLLANTYALAGLTQAAHWNIVGDNFFQLHAAFGDQYAELFDSGDVIAEHIRQNDEYTVGGLFQLAYESEIEDAKPTDKGMDLVKLVLDGNEKALKCILETQAEATKCGDLETQDLTIRRALAHKKAIWMLKSFLKS